MKRVLAISSGGGHWSELMRIRPALAGLDVGYATIQPSSQADVPGCRFHTFEDFSRFSKLSLPRVVWQLIRILWREKPAVVITTGSAPALICLGLAKVMFRSRTIWIDSIANVEKLSSSGAAARLVADVWLTQWPDLARKDGPQCWGAVL